MIKMKEPNKQVPVDVIVKTISLLENGEKATCPLCEIGALKAVVEGVKNCHCYICDFCNEKLNIN